MYLVLFCNLPLHQIRSNAATINTFFQNNDDLATQLVTPMLSSSDYWPDEQKHNKKQALIIANPRTENVARVIASAMSPCKPELQLVHHKHSAVDR